MFSIIGEGVSTDSMVQSCVDIELDELDNLCMGLCSVGPDGYSE